MKDAHTCPTYHYQLQLAVMPAPKNISKYHPPASSLNPVVVEMPSISFQLLDIKDGPFGILILELGRVMTIVFLNPVPTLHPRTLNGSADLPQLGPRRVLYLVLQNPGPGLHSRTYPKLPLSQHRRTPVLHQLVVILNHLH